MSRVSDKPYFLYVLWSTVGHRFCVDISQDPERRLQQHNERISRWSAKYPPWVLVHEEKFENYTQVRRRELELKAQKAGRGSFAPTGLNSAGFGR